VIGFIRVVGGKVWRSDIFLARIAILTQTMRAYKYLAASFAFNPYLENFFIYFHD